MTEPVTYIPRAALLAIMLAGRYRPGQHHHHNGFLQHVFATSPWLGAIAVALIILAGLALALIKTAGRVLDGTPWYVRLALLVTAVIGIFRLPSRKNQATPQGIWHPADGWEPAPPRDGPTLWRAHPIADRLRRQPFPTGLAAIPGLQWLTITHTVQEMHPLLAAEWMAATPSAPSWATAAASRPP